MRERTDERLTTADLAAAVERKPEPPPHDPPRPTPQPATSAAPPESAGEMVSLFSTDDGERLRARWSAIQTNFVDEPRRAVEDADTLVADVIKMLVDTFARERQNLERQWAEGS